MHPVLEALQARREALDEPPLVALGGRFHSHVTLQVPARLDGADRARLDQLAQIHRSKLTVIELADLERRVERDVMLTRYFAEPGPGAVGRIADRLRETVEALLRAETEPVRVKVEHETEPSLPAFDAERYHEVHIKLGLAPAEYEAMYAWLEEAGAELGWRPSRNPYERRADQITQFVTLRAYEGGREDADARVAAALQALDTRGIVPLEVKRETTVLDTRCAHDAWWAT